ncbi:hypothetical protein VTK26DRAFT_9166 [Humicola hyalothermophila]
MTVGDNALRGEWERIDHQLFPPSGRDKEIAWKAPTTHIGGRMKIGGQSVPSAELRGDGSRRVPAGDSVEITHMEAKFQNC